MAIAPDSFGTEVHHEPPPLPPLRPLQMIGLGIASGIALVASIMTLVGLMISSLWTMGIAAGLAGLAVVLAFLSRRREQSPE